MKCEKCEDIIESGEERDYHGQTLCEDCYMDALSPARTCDPWAVYTAKSLVREDDGSDQLTTLQAKVLEILEETGGVEPQVLADRLQIKPADLEREIAALRHMEKIRGELRDGKKVIILW